jgi:heme/copper-type cytochrome/quinol oxidase subunit 2
MKQSAGHSGGHDHASGNDLLALSVKPGETKEWVIKFEQAQTLQMACLIPGHFEAGMKGQVIVQDKDSAAQSTQSTQSGKQTNASHNAEDHSKHKH